MAESPPATYSITSTPTQVSVEGFFDVRLGGRGIIAEECIQRHDDSRGALYGYIITCILNVRQAKINAM